jgi:hypothetical protein
MSLREVADDFIATMSELVDSLVFLNDTKRLRQLISLIRIFAAYMILDDINSKGYHDEFRDLCERIGKRGECG